MLASSAGGAPDPLSERERSARWNPLGYVSETPYRCIDDLQR
ncbi:type IV secretory pathway TraG/TraD family ATPase VirD4, partial [Variovorax sp. 3319]|nr:type IV secretory pathway TraG/TraD family ATPase VirD4 [Variovorax sp. 3319]